MSQAVYDNILIISYLLIWILTFGWYQYKRNVLDGGSAIILSYIAYAIFSILTLNNPIPIAMYAYEPLKVFPFIYLYVMLMIAISPAIYHHLTPVRTIEDPHTRTIHILSIIIIICSVMLIPNIVTNFGDGVIKLFTDNDAGKDAYAEQLKEAEDSGNSISNLVAIIYNMSFDISVFLSFYLLSLKKKNPAIVILLFMSLLIGIFMAVMKGQRSVVILNLLTIIAGYMLFREYISKRINRAILTFGIGCIVTISLPVAAITISRFDNRERSSAISDYLNWYIGQANLYFNNYGLDAGGVRYGDRTMNLVKRLIDPSTPSNYVERREKYHNLKLDDNVFSTFVGDFTIDYGPVIAVVIFIVFNAYVLIQIRPRGDTIKLHQMLLLFFSISICMQGGMYLFAYSDTANLRILAFGLLYAYLRYHDALIEHFPLIGNKNEIQ